jgi:uncharacterized protein (DUF2062 family)
MIIHKMLTERDLVYRPRLRHRNSPRLPAQRIDAPNLTANVPPVSDAAPHPSPTGWPAGLVALVPVYNHARTVGDVVRELRSVGAHVIVVDDGSQDGSGQAAADAGAEVLTHAHNQGKGAALRTGFAHAASKGYRQVLSVDADGQHPLSASLLLVHAAHDHTTIYVGCRQMDDAPAVSRFGRWWSNVWSWIACNVWVGDSQSGLRIYPLPFVNQLPHSANRYSYEVEVLVRGVWAGLLVEPISVPVIYQPDRVSHFHKLRDTWRTACLFSRLVTRRLWPKKHTVLVERKKLSVKEKIHALIASGLAPGPAGAACALGAAIGVAPIPGLQFAAAVFFAWRLKFNMPLVLLTSNLSFGPLLFVWGAICSALGAWMRTGKSFIDNYHAIFAEFQSKGTSVSGINELMFTFIGDWFLGSLIVIPVVAGIMGALGFTVFYLARRGMAA